MTVSFFLLPSCKIRKLSERCLEFTLVPSKSSLGCSNQSFHKVSWCLSVNTRLLISAPV